MGSSLKMQLQKFDPYVIGYSAIGLAAFFAGAVIPNGTPAWYLYGASIPLGIAGYWWLFRANKNEAITGAGLFGAKANDVQEAEKMLSEHGYQACMYFPAAGIEDEQIAAALRCVSRRSNRLILTSNGQLVGKVSLDTLPGNGGEERKTESRCHLTLVVSNTDKNDNSQH